MTALLFLSLRAAHVMLAALWLGSHACISMLFMPAIEAAGPSGGQVMMRVNRRGITAYMVTLGALTIATGLYLLWRFTGGFDPAVGATHAGLAFAIGGTCGILAFIVGGSVIGRSANRVAAIAGETAAMPDGAARRTLLQHAAALRRRMKIGSHVVLLLQAVALVLMAVGHYV